MSIAAKVPALNQWSSTIDGPQSSYASFYLILTCLLFLLYIFFNLTKVIINTT